MHYWTLMLVFLATVTFCIWQIQVMACWLQWIYGMHEFNSSPSGQNGRHVGRWQCQMYFLEWKWWFPLNFFQEVNWQYASIGSGNGLAPNRRQAYSWTNADPVHWCIYVTLGGDELIYTNLWFVITYPNNILSSCLRQIMLVKESQGMKYIHKTFHNKESSRIHYWELKI